MALIFKSNITKPTFHSTTDLHCIPKVESDSHNYDYCLRYARHQGERERERERSCQPYALLQRSFFHREDTWAFAWVSGAVWGRGGTVRGGNIEELTPQGPNTGWGVPQKTWTKKFALLYNFKGAPRDCICTGPSFLLHPKQVKFEVRHDNKGYDKELQQQDNTTSATQKC